MNRPTQLTAVERAYQIASLYLAERGTQSPRPVASTAKLRAGFDIALSEHGRPATDVINDLVDASKDGLVGNTSPDFYGWVMGSSNPVGVAADILTSAWGQNAAIYQTAPAAAVAEEVAASWLLELLDLPRTSSVGFTTGATMASYIALSAARFNVLWKSGWNIADDGLSDAPRIPIVISEEAHASIHSVLRYLGFGKNQITCIPVDTEGRMRIPELEKVIAEFERPGIVIAQAGHINSGAFDYIGDIADLAKNSGSWLHVDGAFGLWARCSTTVCAQTAGVEKADSWAVDGHKWLQVPYDSGYAIVRHADAHRRAMCIDASYLNRDELDGRNPSEFGPELSRRARGFTTWATIQTLGKRGIARMVDRHCSCARELASELSRIPGVEILNDVCLNQVAVTFTPPSRTKHLTALENATDQVIAELQRENLIFVSGADWSGHRIMRISVIAGETSHNNVTRLVQAIERAWTKVLTTAETHSAPQLPDTLHQTTENFESGTITPTVNTRLTQRLMFACCSGLFWTLFALTTLIAPPT
ncbi:MAG: aminotransferase class V-fold PLP-dependent enzyme [Granulosicoccus sp.]|nr:aminotransferase class V-fold PLP-dependent enzyme [Granulosicoccus sp.]